MTKKTVDKDFVLALEELSDEVPMDAEEITETLESVGLDPAKELARTMAALDEVAERVRNERFARAREERLGALSRIKTGVKRTKQELLARIEELKGRLPAGAELQAFHKNLESVSDEDLASLVAQYEELIERGQE
jgi:predicted HAD superfamily phosphohydrolase